MFDQGSVEREGFESRWRAGSSIDGDPALADLVAAVDGLATRGLPIDAAVIAEVHRQIDRLGAVVSDAEVTFDRYELWRDEGDTSMRGWFSRECAMGRRASNAVARRVERLAAWPEVAAAWRAGRVSGAQVDLVVAAVPRRFVTLFAEHSATVVRVIEPLDMGATEFVLHRWVRMAESGDGPDDLHERDSGLAASTLPDGALLLRGELRRAVWPTPTGGRPSSEPGSPMR